MYMRESDMKKDELKQVARMPDNEIDYSDAPALPDEMWDKAVRGKFYRPVKEQVTVRIDADVLAWLKQRGKGYQTRLNDILREAMIDDHKV